MTKESDIIHTKRSLNTQLHELKKNNKELTEPVIQHICKCFAYAVTQNVGNVTGIKDALATIIPHCYGEHDKCGDWCGFTKDASSYKRKGFKGDLQDNDTRQALDSTMKTFIDNAEKFAGALNSQSNEAFNQTIASKALKCRHYGSSESNDYRVAAAVCQKNVGRTYVANVYQDVSLSPGNFTILNGHKVDNEAVESVTKRSQKSSKLRRIELKKEKASKRNTAAIREGISYEKDIGYSQEVDTEEIPPPTTMPSLETIDVEESGETLVIFDVETTCAGNDYFVNKDQD